MKIILIDDDRDDGLIFEDVLQEIDPSAKFEQFIDPRESLKKLLESGTDLPDLIFLDLICLLSAGGIDWRNLKRRRVYSKYRFLCIVPLRGTGKRNSK